jgi:hypothetical protein
LIKLHDKYIMDNIPKDRLLIMRTEELAWEPLCKFLGKPIPNEPFPRANDRTSADRIATAFLIKLTLRWVALISTAAVGSYSAYLAYRYYLRQ